jgi:pimeloyl-ACP methyl ester carboxylesterase
MAREMPQVDGVTHREVLAGNVRIHVAEAGEGPPLLLLHGWPQHWWLWREVIPRLAPQHRLIMPDTRGFGWSDAPRRGYEKEQIADDVLAVLDALEVERVGLVGHDWGGWVGFLLCLRAPERFSRYLALNMAHPWIKPAKALPHVWRFAYQWILSTPGLGFWLVHRTRSIERSLARSGLSEHDARVFASQFREPERARASVQLYRTFVLREQTRVRGRYRKKRLPVPTLQLHGADDPVLRPSMLPGFEEHADDMRLEIVPDCGHFIVDERPELVAERAREFFAAPIST